MIDGNMCHGCPNYIIHISLVVNFPNRKLASEHFDGPVQTLHDATVLFDFFLANRTKRAAMFFQKFAKNDTPFGLKNIQTPFALHGVHIRHDGSIFNHNSFMNRAFSEGALCGENHLDLRLPP